LNKHILCETDDIKIIEIVKTSILAGLEEKRGDKSILVVVYVITFMDFVLSRFGQVYIQSFWVHLCLSIQDDSVYNNVW
jgi:hypothetical protein